MAGQCGPSNTGYLFSMINYTPYTWTLGYVHSYQMSSWTFPATIAGGTHTTVCVVPGSSGTTTDDAGEATFSIAGTSDQFQVQYRSTGMQVALTSMTTRGNPQGSIALGTEWILAGETGAYVSSNADSSTLPSSWMTQNLDYLGGRTIGETCLPGVHDAAMGVFTDAVNANYWNTQSQVFTVGDQLTRGARWFDLRALYSGGNYYTYHGGGPALGQNFIGAYGQPWLSIISDINAFTATNKELIILDVSHGYDRDAQAGFTDNEWFGLYKILLGINNRYKAGRTAISNGATVDKFEISDIIANSAGVIILTEGPRQFVGPDGTNYGNEGFYSIYTDFPVYNNYANSDVPATIASDQISKMNAQRTSPDSGEFLLSWQYTMSVSDSANAGQGGRGSSEYSLLSESGDLYQLLMTTGVGAFTNKVYPNVILVDGYGCRVASANRPQAHCTFNSTNIVSLCMAINYQSLPICG